MGTLIDDMIELSRIARFELHNERVDLSVLVQNTASTLRNRDSNRLVDFKIQEGIMVHGDTRLLEIVVNNLLGNAFKFTGKMPEARIEFGQKGDSDTPTFFVRDNGAGFDMAFAKNLFGAFQRLHSTTEFPGTGVGLATVQRIIHRHGGRIWAESAVGLGDTFYFNLQETP